MIKITADSTCDLPEWLLEKHDITVIPLGIVHGGGAVPRWHGHHHRGYCRPRGCRRQLTTTNAVNIADYERLFRDLATRYGEVIHINIGTGFSCCHQNAVLAAEEARNVHVLSSENLSVGHGMLVLTAAEAAEAGKSAAEILDMLSDMAPKLEMSFVLDRLDYMKKGGRCSSVTALGANLLKLHPCIEVMEGRMSVVKKYRGSMEKAVEDYLRDRLADRTDIDRRRAILVDTCQDNGLTSIARNYLEENQLFDEVIEAKAGCAIFSHCGPNALGILLLRK